MLLPDLDGSYWVIPFHENMHRSSRRGFRGRRHDSVREPDVLEAHVRFDERGVETGFMVRTVRHRQSKEAATDMPDL